MAVPRPRTQIHPVMHPPQTLSPPRLPPVETGRREDSQKGNSYTLKISVIQVELAFERTIRQAPAALQEGNRLVEEFLKRHC